MNDESVSWVIYLMTLRNQPDGVKAICDQTEWERLERERPGYHKLIQAGIATETQAEILARGETGNQKARPRLKARWAAT